MEKQLFFNSDDISLFGVKYQPKAFNNKGFLIVHPFAEEKKSSQRTLVEIAEALCKAGFYVFMFDLRGCGDSGSQFKEASISGWLRDIHRALAFFKKESKVYDISIIGLRLGAYLAMLYNSHVESKKLILIEPIIRPVDYLRKTLRHKLIKELCTEGEIRSKRNDLIGQLKENISIDFDGHELSALFYKDLISHEGLYNPEYLVESVKDSYLISISLTGKMSKDSAEFVRLNSQITYKVLKMELFWDKVDEISTDELIQEVVGYCLSDY